MLSEKRGAHALAGEEEHLALLVLGLGLVLHSLEKKSTWRCEYGVSLCSVGPQQPATVWNALCSVGASGTWHFLQDGARWHEQWRSSAAALSVAQRQC